MKFVCTSLLILALSTSWSQKKVINHEVYDNWKSLSSEKISNDGLWVGYIIAPQIGDGTLHIHNTKSGKRDSLQRVKSFQFGPNSNYILATIDPGYDTLRTLKLKKTKADKLPKDSAAVWLLDADSVVKFSNYKGSFIPKEGDRFIINLDKSSFKFKTRKKKKCFLKKKIAEVKKDTKGKDCIIINGATGSQTTHYKVTGSALSENGEFLNIIQHEKIDTLDYYQVESWNLTDNVLTQDIKLGADITDVKGICVSYHGNFGAFYTSIDTSKNKVYSLEILTDTSVYHLRTDDGSMPEDWSVSGNRSLQFSEDEKRLYFGIAPHPYNEIDDSLLDTERYKLDLWHWRDNEIQPRQLKQQRKDRNKSFLSVLNLEDQSWMRLQADNHERVEFDPRQTHKHFIAYVSDPYEVSYSWTMPWVTDVYLIDGESGETKLLKKQVGFSSSLSPNGKYFIYFDHKNNYWSSIDLTTFSESKIRIDDTDPLYRDINGSPRDPGSNGLGAWTDNDEFVLVNSQHHVWLADPTGKKNATNLNEGLGDDIISRYILWDREKRTIDLNSPMYFSLFSEKSKSAGFSYKANAQSQTVILDSGAYMISSVHKAKDTDKFIYRKMTFRQYPDVYLSDDLKSGTRLSETNPQTKDFSLGSVQLTKWKSYNGLDVEGLVYLPEDFDAAKKYPMMVYFYERNDNTLHKHYSPRPTASIIFPGEYVSNGYVVFVPNIEYMPGAPGNSAYDCILSGVDHVLDQYSNIDSSKMALQGQSWGGYQTAYLITRTNRFAAAMAGAPVSNMTSAYGGIRWGSGLSRQFMYERTQSRIGGTLWDSLDAYIHNSPVFFAPKVETPLMIMHNDNDGAVPWYQGIEYFTALRRLNKPVWLLNYNGEEHNLMKRPNRVDLSRRMLQFFNHYLKDEPAPVWLKYGIPAVDKGRKDGYELIQD